MIIGILAILLIFCVLVISSLVDSNRNNVKISKKHMEKDKVNLRIIDSLNKQIKNRDDSISVLRKEEGGITTWKNEKKSTLPIVNNDTLRIEILRTVRVSSGVIKK